MLTAAHCLMKLEPEYEDNNKIIVILGAHNYDYDDAGRLEFISTKYKIHEEFSMKTIVNDIGLIRLPSSTAFTDHIKPIKISSEKDLGNKEANVIVAGWGFTDNTASFAKQLQTAKMKVLPFKDCEQFKYDYMEELTEKNICVIGRDNKKEKVKMICSGDS